MGRTRRILIIDDNEADRSLAELVVRQQLKDAEVVVVARATAFAECLLGGDITAAVVERNLAWEDGQQVLKTIRAHFPHALLFLYARELSPDLPSLAVELGLSAYLRKDAEGFLELGRAVVRGLDLQAQKREGGLEHYIEGLPVGVCSITREGRIRRLNAVARGLLGVADPATGDRDLDLDLDLERRVPALQKSREWRALLQGESTHFEQVVDVPGANGPQRLRLRLRLASPAERGQGFEGIIEPLAEMASSDVTAAFKQINEELEQLAYAVSHDLQEPLQLVLRNARLLSSRYGGNLDEEAGRFLGHMVHSSERMQAMLDGMLTYSRLGSSQPEQRPVSLEEVLDEVLATYRPQLEETKAQVQVTPLPTLKVDRLQIQQLFMNLVGNALKFRSNSPLKLSISAQEESGVWRFAVQDNGIGIGKQYQERIFGMFQRLHTEEEYPGTGIGLAICKRIVEQHGGKIWVHSQPDEGATFFFTLPK